MLIRLKFSEHFSNPKGQMLVEILMVIALSAIILPAILTGFVASRESKPQEVKRIKAAQILKETETAVKNIKDSGWNNIPASGIYHPEVSGTQWTFVSGANTTSDGITQQVTISSVQRDVNGNIVPTGGSDDPSTKRADISISWSIPQNGSLTSVLYLTRFTNAANLITNTSDFNTGTPIGTAVVDTVNPDGQVQLGGGGHGSWCAPTIRIPEFVYNLPGQGITTSISAVEGHAYTTTGGNSSGHSLDSVNISNPPYPTLPAPSNGGSYDNRKTYGIYATTNYVYLTSNHNDFMVDIVAASNLTHAGFFKPNPSSAGVSVFTSGNIGYVTAENKKLYAFDISTIDGQHSQPVRGSVTLDGIGKRVYVVDTYAYVITDSTSNQLDIVDIHDLDDMRVVGRLNLNTPPYNNDKEGVDVVVNNIGTYAYLVTQYDADGAFYIVNISTKTNPIVVGSLVPQGAMNPKGVTLGTAGYAVMVGSGEYEYQVIKISKPETPSLCKALAVDGTNITSIHAISTVKEADGDVYSYVVTNNSSEEFLIIEGGAGGILSTTGTYESSTIDPGFTAAFNRFVANVDIGVGTSIKAQVGVANPGVGQTCSDISSYNFVGPNGDPSQYFLPVSNTITALIPFGTYGTLPNQYQNPGRCFRYKFWLDSPDTSQTPVLFDFNVNYSP